MAFTAKQMDEVRHLLAELPEDVVLQIQRDVIFFNDASEEELAEYRPKFRAWLDALALRDPGMPAKVRTLIDACLQGGN